MESKKQDKHTPSVQSIVEKRKRLAKISHILDTAFTIPIIKVRIGFDAIIGMIPVIGDIIGGLLSLYFIVQAIQLRISFFSILKMLLNIAIELLVGLVPVFGDLFDISWRANLKNYQVIDAHLTKELHRLGYKEPAGEKGDHPTANIFLQIILVALALLALFLLRQPIYDSLSTLPQYLYN